MLIPWRDPSYDSNISQDLNPSTQKSLSLQKHVALQVPEHEKTQEGWLSYNTHTREIFPKDFFLFIAQTHIFL